MLRRSKLVVSAAVIGALVGGVAPPAGADRVAPAPCRVVTYSLDGDELYVAVAGSYTDYRQGDVVLTCNVVQYGRVVASFTDAVYGPVAAVTGRPGVDFAPFEVCYDLVISDPFDGWGRYEHRSSC